MKYLLSFVSALLLVCSAKAASPDYKSFRGTGGILVTTNPPTGTVVIDGSAISGGGSNFVTASFGSSTHTNGAYLGQQGNVGTFYAFETSANAYRRVLVMSPAGYVFGTNGLAVLFLGSNVSPGADDTTALGTTALRWKGAFFKDLVRVDGSLNVSTNIAAGTLTVTNGATVGSLTVAGSTAGSLTLSDNDGSHVFRLASVPVSHVNVTNLVGIVETNYAAVMVINANEINEYSVTNRANTANTSLILSNTATGQTIAAHLVGEIAGGTSRTVTIIAHLGQLVANMDTYGSPLATSMTVTLTNGNALEISDRIVKQNGTNIHKIVTRQYAF